MKLVQIQRLIFVWSSDFQLISADPTLILLHPLGTAYKPRPAAYTSAASTASATSEAEANARPSAMGYGAVGSTQLGLTAKTH